MKKLNLGCGKDIKQGYVNLDNVKLGGVDVVHNLNKVPYPFKDNTFEEIYCSHILEHLNDIPAVLRELWRISKPGAKIVIKVPHFSSSSAWTDLTHRHPFGWMSLDYMAGNNTDWRSVGGRLSHEYGSKEKFNIKRKLIFGRLHRFFGLGLLFNKFPVSLYETFYAYNFPARQIEFYLETVK